MAAGNEAQQLVGCVIERNHTFQYLRQPSQSAAPDKAGPHSRPGHAAWGDRGMSSRLSDEESAKRVLYKRADVGAARRDCDADLE